MAKMKRMSLSDAAREVQTEAAPMKDSTPNEPGGKKRATFHLSADLIDRLRNAVYWSPGLTLAGLAEEALERKLAELEAERGEPFPERKEELRGGRPVK
jgi:hypothetical protein